MQKRMIGIGVTVWVLALMVGGLSTAKQEGGGLQEVVTKALDGGPVTPAKFQEMMMGQMKERLDADDQAWEVIKPRLAKVMDLNRQVSAGRGPVQIFGGGPIGPGPGPGGPVVVRMSGAGTPDDGGPQLHTEFGGPMIIRQTPAPGEETALDKSITQLRTALDNPSASLDDVKKQLAAVRETREKLKRDLFAAQLDLTKILTLRQEAQLVLMGQLN